jgi:RluA family pseudouridine synthase
MLIPILFEDQDLLVVDKPAGLPVLPDGWDPASPYLVDLLQADYGKLWIVHRLDKVTSGVLLLARNAAAHRNLNMQFEHRQVLKKYHAILVGVPDWLEKQASQPIRSNSGHSHRTVVDWKNGKPSITRFQVIQIGSGHTLVEASPETGRTHQIRTHAAALGFPILADGLYGAPPTAYISRPALHAFSLQILHPVDQKTMDFLAPYPSEFQVALSSLKLDRAYLNIIP